MSRLVVALSTAWIFGSLASGAELVVTNLGKLAPGLAAACRQDPVVVHLEGPLGAGKTTLVSEWLHEQERPALLYTMITLYHQPR